MSSHLYVDESQKNGLLVAAVRVPCSEVKRVRAAVLGMKLEREERLHMTAQSPERRVVLLGKFLALGVAADIYDASRHADPKVARDAVMARLGQDVAENGVVRLVLERHMAADSDRSIIKAHLVKADRLHDVSFQHAEARAEPLLGLADGVVWFYAKGGSFRKRVSGMIEGVHQV